MGLAIGLLLVAWVAYYVGKTRGLARYTEPVEVKERAILVEALRRIGRDDVRGACVILKHYMGEYPDATGPYLALGSLYRWIGEAERAIRIHENMETSPLASEEERVDALIELGFDHVALGEESRAAEIFGQLEKTRRRDFLVDLHLSRLYLRLERWEKAYIHLHRFMKQSRQWDKEALATVQTQAGKNALLQGRHKKALGFFQNAVDYDDQQVGAHLGIAESHLHLKKAKKALPVIVKAFQSFPDDIARTAPILFQVHEALGDNQGSEELLRSFLADNPTSAEGHLVFAEYLEQAGRNEEAFLLFEKAVELAPGDRRIRQRYLRALHASDPQEALRQGYELYLELPETPRDKEMERLVAFDRDVLKPGEVQELSEYGEV